MILYLITMLDMTLMVWLAVKSKPSEKKTKQKKPQKTVPNYYGEQIIFPPNILFMPRHQNSGGVLCYTLWNFECLSVRQRPHHSSARNSSYSFRPVLFKLYRRF